MAKKPGGYDDITSKKEVGLVVKTLKGMLQFPDGASYTFGGVFGIPFLIVRDAENKIVAHVAVSELESVHGPTTLFRDGRWR